MTGNSNKKTTIYRSKWVEWIFVNLPFVCYLGFLGVVYIGISHSSERKLRKIDTLQKEVKNTRWHYMSIKQDVMYSGTQSEMKKEVRELGLRTPEGMIKVVEKEKVE